MNEMKIEQINKVNKLKSIYGKREHYYVFTHTYDTITPTPVYIKSNIRPKLMDLLVAFIQFKASNILMEYEIYQTDLKDLLIKHFNCEEVMYVNHTFTEIDLYLNWEYWCSVAENVESINHFNKTELLADIEKLVKKGNEE